MMYLTINTSHLVRGHLDDLINQIKANSWDAAKKTISAIKGDIIKYYATSGLDWKNPGKICDDMLYSIEHFTKPKWRQDKIYELCNLLIKTLSTFDSNATLKDRLMFFCNSLQQDFTLLCETGDPKIRDNLQHAPAELFKLSMEVKKKGHSAYRYYEILMGELGRCTTLLTKMQIQITRDGKFAYNKSSTEKLSDSWSGVFSAFNNLLSSFDEPLEKGPMSPTVVRPDADDNIDDLKEQATRDRYYRLLTDENMKPSEIAEMEHVDVDDVVDILFPNG